MPAELIAIHNSVFTERAGNYLVFVNGYIWFSTRILIHILKKEFTVELDQ